MSSVTNPIVRPSGVLPVVAGGEPILIVDDSLVDRRIAARVLVQAGGWSPAYASNGVEALEAMAKSLPRVVLTDLQMPQMDGLTLVQQIRERYPKVPVILMTGTGSEEIAVQALRAGAASYVPKRNVTTSLIPALEQVMVASRVDEPRQRMLACMTQQDVRFSLPPDPELIPPLTTLLRENLLAMGLCDATGATRVGIALEEALLNAIYYGTLEIPSGLKQKDEAAFKAMLQQRRQESPYRERRVRLFVNMTTSEAAYVVFDQGRGFDTSKLPDLATPAALEQSSGRGIMLMRTFMDRVTYSQTGNQVTLLKRRETRGVRP